MQQRYVRLDILTLGELSSFCSIALRQCVWVNPSLFNAHVSEQ